MKHTKPKIGSLAYKLNFGKYKNSRLDLVLYEDPSYILWLKKENILNLTERIVKKAEEVKEEQFEQKYGDFYTDQMDLY